MPILRALRCEFAIDPAQLAGNSWRRELVHFVPSVASSGLSQYPRQFNRDGGGITRHNRRMAHATQPFHAVAYYDACPALNNTTRSSSPAPAAI